MHQSNTSCYVFMNTSTMSYTFYHIHDMLAYPSLLCLALTLIQAGIILVALIVARCQHSSVGILYFNITITDITMALVGIILILLPETSSVYQRGALLVQVLR